VYGNVRSDLHAYEQDVTTTSTDQGALTARTQELQADQVDLTAARQKLAVAQHALEQFAIATYVNGGTYSGTSFMNLAGPKPFGPQNTDGVVANQYENIVASELDGQQRSAASAEKGAQDRRDSAAKAVLLANTALASDNAAETRALARLVDDVVTLQKAGACTTAVITVAAPGAPAPAGQPASASPSTSATTTTTTTSTTVPPAAPTTTTTTVPPTTTTTGAVPTTVPAVEEPPTTVPTTVPVPPTTAPPASTTTTTAPGGAGSKAPTTATPQTPNPGGLQVLQGCVTALAPQPGQ
jgi:hypothetical protein